MLTRKRTCQDMMEAQRKNMSGWDVDNEKDISGYYGGLEKDMPENDVYKE